MCWILTSLRLLLGYRFCIQQHLVGRVFSEKFPKQQHGWLALDHFWNNVVFSLKDKEYHILNQIFRSNNYWHNIKSFQSQIPLNIYFRWSDHFKILPWRSSTSLRSEADDDVELDADGLGVLVINLSIEIVIHIYWIFIQKWRDESATKLFISLQQNDLRF